MGIQGVFMGCGGFNILEHQLNVTRVKWRSEMYVYLCHLREAVIASMAHEIALSKFTN